MKKLLLILLCLPMIGLGQGWEQIYSPLLNEADLLGYNSSFQQTSDGGVIFTGTTWSNTLDECKEIFIIKTDNQGIQLWRQSFSDLESLISPGDYEYYEARSVKQTNDGGYVIVGDAKYGGANQDSDVLLIKIDENGAFQWQQQFSIIIYSDNSSGKTTSTFATDVIQTDDGGYLIAGYAEHYQGAGAQVNTDGTDLLLIKTDDNGNEQWKNVFNKPYNQLALELEQSSNGDFIIHGFDLTFGNPRYNVLKTNSSGTEEWYHSFIHEAENQTFWEENENARLAGSGGTGTFQQSNDGGYIKLSSVIIDEDINSYDINEYTYSSKLIKMNENGVQQWEENIESNNSFIAGMIQTIDNDYVYLTLSDHLDYSNPNIVFYKTNENGEEQWTRTFDLVEDLGVMHTYSLHGVKKTNDGGYIIGGSISFVEDGFYNIFMIKTNSFGNITSVTEIPLSNTKRKIKKTINLQGQEVKPQPNTPLIEIYDDGTVEKKIIIE